MKVHYRQRARGCDVRLLDFLDWWEAHGPFEITICPDGGVRTDAEAQLDYFISGTSKARTLDQTPHGRAGALDLAPLINGKVPWSDMHLFGLIGRLAKARGLQWGGDWPHPDSDHIQVPNWKELPFPPEPVTVS